MNVYIYFYEKFVNECEILCEVCVGVIEIYDFEEEKLVLDWSLLSLMNLRFE